MSGIRLPLVLSVAGHALCAALVALLLSGQAPRLPTPTAKGGIEVVFESPPQPAPPAAAPDQPNVAPPPAETPVPPDPQAELPAPEPPAIAAEPMPPPEPEPPAIVSEPTSPASEAPVAASEPPPPHKPAVRKPPKPVVRRQETEPTSQAYFPTPPPQSPAPQSPPAPVAPPQTALAATPVPAPVPSPEASAGYRALLSAWLESHKRYPEAARQRGEEGRAVLRFTVERSGRVVDSAVVTSSGYPDLDEAIEEMMRGATLPPFPAGMPQPRMEVSITIRFSLRR